MYEDPTGDLAMSRLNHIMKDREANAEIDELLERVKAYMDIHGYGIHGKVAVIDKNGKCRVRYI